MGKGGSYDDDADGDEQSQEDEAEAAFPGLVGPGRFNQ